MPTQRVGPCRLMVHTTSSCLRNHIPVHLEIHLESETFTPQRISTSRTVEASLMRNHLAELYSDEETLTIEEATEKLTKSLLESAKTHKKGHQRIGKPWFNAECRKSLNLCSQVWQSSRRNSDMLILYSECGRNYHKLLKETEKKYVKELETKRILEAQQLAYRYLRNSTPTFSCPIPPKKLRNHYLGLIESVDTVPQSIPLYSTALNPGETFQTELLRSPFTVF